MQIKTIPIKRINPATYNPRVDLQPGDADYDKLQRSLEEFGCVEPLVWNRRTGNLVGGHQRLKILAAQGEAQVEVSVVDLPLPREQALNLALNKIGGDWDERKLADLLTGLAEIPEFDVGLTGFDSTEITNLLDRLEALEAEDDFDLADALAAADCQEPVTQPGELLELGRHRLLCGDAVQPDDLARLLVGDKADLVFTDPPYNVNYYGGNRPTPHKARPKRSRSWKRIYMDDLNQDEYEAWLARIMRNLLSALAPGAAVYVWNGHKQFGPMHALMTEAGAHVSCVLVWAKESFAIGYGDYSQQTEFCLYGWKAQRKGGGEKSAHRWYGPTNESTLWQVHRDRTREYRHPTQKPLALAERALRNSSRRGETVLDLFLGSGSTLIAAERLERRCLGMEIDPRYCDAIVRRYLAFMGDRAPNHLLERYRLPSDDAAKQAHLAEATA
ncbi:MAG: DNA modification methylase [Planctomycetes bacterium]|nr:DNA modification methylase [Planctomycetota bacterium]